MLIALASGAQESGNAYLVFDLVLGLFVRLYYSMIMIEPKVLLAFNQMSPH